ncbi:brachyurin-like [Lucilia sericata]|uniref:brachyurin-like n=1 Tax=Lucilia sericata TaxID=13632 RepID=UPI0018A828CF|nr:brachyurin-like [Lucilia sericata]
MKTYFIKLIILGILCWLYVRHNQTTASSAFIVDGTQAALGQFPWHVLLRRDAQDELLGAGSIIANKWVLTAAHCVYGRSFVHLEFGTVNLYFDGLIMNSTKFYIYPQYNHRYLTDDIALIELPEELTFDQNINAIELVSSIYVSNDFVNEIGIVTGFGWPSNQANNFSEWLLWGNVEVISNEDCAREFDENIIENTAMCTIGYAGSDITPCKGDSGGALVWENQYGKLVQIGVASFAKVNRCSEFPAAYARVTSFLVYIHNITGLY